MTEHLPPQAVEVEQQIIGACLIWGATERTLAVLRTSGALYHRPHALILDACRALLEAGSGVDQTTVAEALRQRGQLDAVGGLAYLAELSIGSVTAANVVHHCQIVLRAARLRLILLATQEAQVRVYGGNLEPEQIAQDLEERLSHLGTDLAGGARRLDAVLADTLDDLEYRHAHPGLAGIGTGLTELDGLTSGWQAGDLILLAARPSLGKTSLVVGMVEAAARSGIPVLCYSLEMPARHIGHRLLSRQTRIDLHRLRNARLGEAEWREVTTAAAELSGRPLWVDDTAGLTLPDIQARARRLHRQEGIGLIAVDYLQLVEGTDSRDTQERETARISRGLKLLAKELRVPVLALSQLSRAPEGRADHRPVLSDLRYSGALEQDSDTVVFIFQPKGQEGVAELIISKQRNGPVGTIRVQWDAATATFRDLAPVMDEPEEAQSQWWGNR